MMLFLTVISTGSSLFNGTCHHHQLLNVHQVILFLLIVIQCLETECQFFEQFCGYSQSLLMAVNTAKVHNDTLAALLTSCNKFWKLKNSRHETPVYQVMDFGVKTR